MSTNGRDFALCTCVGCGADGVIAQNEKVPAGWTGNADAVRCPKCVALGHAPTDRPRLPIADILPSALAEGAAAAVYGKGIRIAVEHALPDIVESHCGIALLHSGPDDQALHASACATVLRHEVPGIEVWIAIGCDWRLRQQRLAGNRYNADSVVRHLSTVGDTARRAGAARIMLDPETELELLGEHSPALAVQIVRDTLAEIRLRAPLIPIAFTSFDQPDVHASIPWHELLGAGSPVDEAFEQVYGAPGEGYCPRGTIIRRQTKALGAWAKFVRAGQIREDVEPDPGPSDLDWYPYLQLHGIPASDTIRLGVERRKVAGWALGTPERYDAQGRLAWRSICQLRRYGFVGPDAVLRFERAVGLHVDRDPHGVAGPEVQGALAALK